MDAAVNWKHLSDAVTFFTEAGYEYVEAPWIAPDYVLMATCPSEDYVVSSKLGGLVGSAEQSFIHLKRIGAIGEGRFVACTPCFRNEDEVDTLHQRTFMKVELYSSKFDITELDATVELVMSFYRSLLAPDLWQHLQTRVTGSHSVDIELGGIEVGSYGMRSWEGESWVYGTGIAEPRFSTARNLIRD